MIIDLSRNDRDHLMIFSSSVFQRKKVELLWYPWRLRRLRHKTLTLPHNLKTVIHIQMKLGTFVLGNTMHVCAKSHNSGFNNYSVMTLFRLRNSYKIMKLAHNLETVTHIQKKLGTLVLGNTTHVCAKSHNSGFKNYSVMPLFRLRNSYKIIKLTYNSKTVQYF